jgi:host factor-I protein
MAQMPEAKTPADPNIQDAFLNLVRRERLAVRLRLMDGTDVDARIKSFDRFAVMLDEDGTDHLIFKHAIASIRASRAVPST